MEEFSPFYAFDIYQTSTVTLPRYVPWPSCGFTNEDLIYGVVDSSELPYWITLNELERTVTVGAETTDRTIVGTTTELNLYASFLQIY